jgi:hypothetical protein
VLGKHETVVTSAELGVPLGNAGMLGAIQRPTCVRRAEGPAGARQERAHRHQRKAGGGSVDDASYSANSVKSTGHCSRALTWLV